MKKKLILILIAALSSISIYSQTKIEKLFKRESYFEVIENLKDKEKTNILNYNECELLALSYYYNNDFSNAYVYFTKYLEAKPLSTKNKFYYSHCLRAIGNESESNKILIDYYKESGKNLDKYFEDFEAVKRLGNRYSIKNEAKLNTEYSDIFGTSIEEMIYFSSTRPNGLENEKFKWNGQPYLDIFQMKKDSSIVSFNDINSEYHDGDISINRMNDDVYFTSSKPDPNLFLKKDQVITTKIYKAKFENGKMKNIILLPFNSNEFSCKTPFVDFKNNRLYFSSNKPGGYGGFDIYYVELNDPVVMHNIGEEINTVNDEDNFFIDSEQNQYFSSNAYVGFGGKDIYTRIFDKETQKLKRVMNVGLPVNSKYDDFGYKNYNGKGFFTSNRKDGKGDDDIYSYIELIPLDLDKIIQTITGKITNNLNNKGIANAKVLLVDSNGNTLEALTDASGKYTFENILGDSDYKISASADRFIPNSINFHSTKEKYGTVEKNIGLEQAEGYQVFKGQIKDNVTGNPLKNALVSVYDTSGNLLSSTRTDENGNYEITAPLNKRVLFKVSLNESTDPYYAEYQEYLETTDEWGKVYEKSINLLQTDSRGLISDKNGNILIPTKPIYFGYNSAKVESVSYEELDKVANLLLEHSTWKLIIESHSDDRGSDSYNLKLSEKRAASTKEYLIKNKLIDSNRIICKGFGETKPLIDCLTKECTEEEYQINRRSDFIIK